MTEMDGTDIFQGVDMFTAFNYHNEEVILQELNLEFGQNGGFTLQEGESDKRNIHNNNNLMSPMIHNNSSSVIIKPERISNELGLKSQPNIEIQEDEMLHKTKFDILPPHKNKNPKYVIKYGGQLNTDSVTTKRKASVRIKCEMPTSYKCHITVRYDELASVHKPVNVCRTHLSDNNIKAFPNSMFIVTGGLVHNDIEYLEEEGHTCCRINSEGEYIISFLCWNSCDQHRNHNKDMNIHVKIFDNDFDRLTYNKKIKLRVAENVKRDAGVLECSKAIKRNMDDMIQELHESPAATSKKLHVSQEESDDPTPLSPQPEGPTMICIQVYSKEDIELYSRLASRLGNEVTIIPNTTLVDENLSDHIEY